MSLKTAYIALGSNIGDRKQNLDQALSQLRNASNIRVQKVSSYLENDAVGGPPDSPPFLNATAELQTTLSPRELLNVLLNVEQDMGRIRRQKWDPRPIDLDILLYNNQIIHEPGLTIPHPLMHQRRFVLQPLSEIAADVEHPMLRQSVSALLQQLQSTDGTSK